MNYKKECEAHIKSLDHDIRRAKHEMDKGMKKLSRQYQDRKSEHIEHGDEWFYFEYVEKTNPMSRIKFRDDAGFEN